MNDSQGYLKTPTPYSDKSDIPFGLMEDVIPTAIAMTPTGLKAIPAPGKTTEEFERVANKIWEEDDSDFTGAVLQALTNAHNADMQALRAELETEVNVSRNLAELASGTLDAAKERIKELEAELSDLREDADELRVLTERLVHEPCEDAVHCSCVPLLRKKVKELESQMPKVVVPILKRYGNEKCYECECGRSVCESYKSCHCGAQLNWTEEAK